MLSITITIQFRPFAPITQYTYTSDPIQQEIQDDKQKVIAWGGCRKENYPKNKLSRTNSCQYKGKNYFKKIAFSKFTPAYSFIGNWSFPPWSPIHSNIIQFKSNWGLNNSFQYTSRVCKIAFQFNIIRPLLFYNIIQFELANPTKHRDWEGGVGYFLLPNVAHILS